jgi:hypothetical protein
LGVKKTTIFWRFERFAALASTDAKFSFQEPIGEKDARFKNAPLQTALCASKAELVGTKVVQGPAEKGWP